MLSFRQKESSIQPTTKGKPCRVIVLGSTGSVGINALDVIAAISDRLHLVGLSAHSNWEMLRKQIEQHRPRWAALTDLAAPGPPHQSRHGNAEILRGPESIHRLVTDPDADTVLVAIVGAAGLLGTWAALEAGKTVAVANKETLVMAGPLVGELAARTGATILPVDSEHSAIFQILHGRASGIASAPRAIHPKEKPQEETRGADATPLARPDIRDVSRVVLTSSGGPFRGRRPKELQEVTVAEALQHPTWRMGPKITVDSATLMNKALEVIEARWLFGLEPEQIDVVIHPESVVHSFVEFVDGSVLAQLSPPDMRLPIQYALTYPDRVSGPAERLDWKSLRSLNFERPDLETFPALQLGYEVARRGGTCGAALNAANEAAVSRFLAGSLRFLDIARVCRAILDRHLGQPGDSAHAFQPHPTLDQVLAVDRWVRQEVEHWESGSNATS